MTYVGSPAGAPATGIAFATILATIPIFGFFLGGFRLGGFFFATVFRLTVALLVFFAGRRDARFRAMVSSSCPGLLHALLGAVALELLAVDHFTSLSIGTLSAFASLRSRLSGGSCLPISSRAR